MGTAVRVSKEDFGIRRASSGSPELDTFLSGGFPRGSLILISGNPGTGKTTLTASFLYEGSKRLGENGIYVSFSESKKSFYENMGAIGMDFEKLEEAGHFRFLEMFSATKEGMSEIAKFILEEIKRFEAKRLVIDSYSVMAQALGNQYEGRQVLHTFFSRIMRNMDCTTLVIGEQPTGEYPHRRHLGRVCGRWRHQPEADDSEGDGDQEDAGDEAEQPEPALHPRGWVQRGHHGATSRRGPEDVATHPRHRGTTLLREP